MLILLSETEMVCRSRDGKTCNERSDDLDRRF